MRHGFFRDLILPLIDQGLITFSDYKSGIEVQEVLDMYYYLDKKNKHIEQQLKKQYGKRQR